MSDVFNRMLGPGQAPPQQGTRFRTQLSPQEEYQFAQWVQQNKIPFDAGPLADYDMRGFWKAMVAGQAQRAPNLHFPDTFKTPFHESFSNESKYAGPDAPHWEGHQLKNSRGQVIFDERVGKLEPITLQKFNDLEGIVNRTKDWRLKVPENYPVSPDIEKR